MNNQPCRQCPWRRESCPGYVGSTTPQEWIAEVAGEGVIPCHLAFRKQCVGAAIYRANTSKLPRNPAILRVAPNRKTCFASPQEFLDHHNVFP